MALNATIVWEIQTGGSATNGGGFDTSIGGGGSDLTLGAVAYSVTDAVTNNTTTVTSVGANWGTDVVGNLMYLSGTGTTTGWYTITARGSSSSVTVDRATGSTGGTGITSKVGGPIDAPETILGTTPIAVAGNIVYIKAGNYTLTTTRTIGADGASSGQIWVIGYPSPGPRSNVDIVEGSMPVFTSATTGISIFTLNAANFLVFRNIKVTQTFVTGSSRGSGWVNTGAQSSDITWMNCIADGCLTGWNNGTSAATNHQYARCIACTAKNCQSATLAGFYSAYTGAFTTYINCDSYDGLGNGFMWGVTNGTGGGFTIQDCIADSNALDGIVIAVTSGVLATPVTIEGCSSYNNGVTATNGAGIRIKTVAGTVRGLIKNCILSSNGLFGIQCDTTSVNETWVQINNAYYNNNNAQRSNIAVGVGDITLTGDPFSNAPNRDFTLVTTGGGLQCRGTAYSPRVGILGDATTTYLDIGASQVQLPAAGGGGVMPIGDEGLVF